MIANLAVIGFFLVCFHASLVSPTMSTFDRRAFMSVGLLGSLVTIALTMAGAQFS